MHLDNGADFVVTGGNVGIGTTAPAQTLHVYSGATNTVATFESTDDETGIKIADNDTQGYISVKNNNISLGWTSGLNATNLECGGFYRPSRHR